MAYENSKAQSRRSKLELTVAVLDLVKRGYFKPLHIMYKANLSWISLTKILELLVKKGLIEVRCVKRRRNFRREYYVTEKGKSVAKTYSDLINALTLLEADA